MKSSRRSYVLRRVDGVRESETLCLLARSRSAKPTAQRAVPHACAATSLSEASMLQHAIDKNIKAAEVAFCPQSGARIEDVVSRVYLRTAARSRGDQQARNDL